MSIPDLGPLGVESEACEYEQRGFHSTHRGDAARIAEVAQAFHEAGYLLEALTAEDRREDLEAMRVVYIFNRRDSLDRHLVTTTLSPEIPGAESPSITEIFCDNEMEYETMLRCVESVLGVYCL